MPLWYYQCNTNEWPVRSEIILKWMYLRKKNILNNIGIEGLGFLQGLVLYWTHIGLIENTTKG